ncbi:hypothetical protein PoB_006628400 [Plakobranchus ocellatus]|uniref:Uncharacterized protein n=1 Tax=Plakobranchus ocellatus TaxID=259542 RepID=A0AAV4D6K8_9GAST|nr:hypothetical protein PoB_006628400 [Plakobranchus ocellatus]
MPPSGYLCKTVAVVWRSGERTQPETCRDSTSQVHSAISAEPSGDQKIESSKEYCTMTSAVTVGGVGGKVVSESALRYTGTLLPRIRAPLRRPGLTEGLKA